MLGVVVNEGTAKIQYRATPFTEDERARREIVNNSGESDTYVYAAIDV
ncbi:MAG: hypothetical protein PWR13_969 [Archaeoglobi archaeon]|nr:hypothetical protein [Archaeoglobi archaeon]